MVPAHRRSNLVAFLQKTKVASAEGFNDREEWVVFCRAWVSISPNRGNDLQSSDERVSIVTHTVRGDQIDMSEIKPDMCMVLRPSGLYDTLSSDLRWFDIVGIMHDEDFHADTMIKVQEKPRGYGV